MEQKTFKDFNNADRIDLLTKLFPLEFMVLSPFITNLATYLLEEKELHRQRWNNPAIPFETWLSIVEQASQVLPKFLTSIQSQSAVKLYPNHPLYIFLMESLMIYRLNIRHPNEKFSQCMDWLLTEDTQ